MKRKHNFDKDEEMTIGQAKARLIHVRTLFKPDKMRDPKRIKKIQDKLTKLWEKQPDLRFGQFLIGNGLIEDNPKIWYRSDDELEEHLDKLLKK